MKKPILLMTILALVVPVYSLGISVAIPNPKNCEGNPMQDFLQQINTYAYPQPHRVYEYAWGGQGDLQAVAQIHTNYTKKMGIHCSGFSFIHPRVAIAPAHCFFPGEVNRESFLNSSDAEVDLFFGYNNGRIIDQVHGRTVRLGSERPYIVDNRDFVVVLLDRPARVTPLQPDLSANTKADNLVFAGYSILASRNKGESMSAVVGCEGLGRNENVDLIEHYCSATIGGSGGMLGVVDISRDAAGSVNGAKNPRVIGMQVAERVDQSRRSKLDVKPSSESKNYALPIKNVMEDVNSVIEDIGGRPYSRTR